MLSASELPQIDRTSSDLQSDSRVLEASNEETPWQVWFGGFRTSVQLPGDALQCFYEAYAVELLRRGGFENGERGSDQSRFVVRGVMRGASREVVMTAAFELSAAADKAARPVLQERLEELGFHETFSYTGPGAEVYPLNARHVGLLDEPPLP